MINLYEIKNAYIKGKDIAEINQMYIDAFPDIAEDEQLAVWKQVCSFANVEMVDFLISKGWRAMGTEDRIGNTLLHFLAEPEYYKSYPTAEGRIYEFTKRLLAAKVSPLKKNSDGITGLMVGARVGYFEMLKAYQEAGAKIDWVDRDGNTLLHIAASWSERYKSDLEDVKQRITANFVSFVSLCMELGIDPYQKNNIGETAIDIAIRHKAKSIAVQMRGVDLADQETAAFHLLAGGQDIFQACINQDLEAIDALIRLGENLNEEYDKEGDKYHGMLPLSIAIILHNFEIVDFLLKNGADPMLMDSQSWHPFRYLYVVTSTLNTDSSQFQNKTFQKMVQSFVAAGFNIDTLVDDEEHTLLTVSSKFASSLQLFNSDSVAKTVIGEVVYAGADVNKTNREGISALMYLCIAGQQRGENELLMILEQGASTELRDKNGKTALMYACGNSENSVAKNYCELLEQFGNIMVDVKDNSGKSALDYAAERNNEPLVAWLLERQ